MLYRHRYFCSSLLLQGPSQYQHHKEYAVDDPHPVVDKPSVVLEELVKLPVHRIERVEGRVESLRDLSELLVVAPYYFAGSLCGVSQGPDGAQHVLLYRIYGLGVVGVLHPAELESENSSSSAERMPTPSDISKSSEGSESAALRLGRQS